MKIEGQWGAQVTSSGKWGWTLHWFLNDQGNTLCKRHIEDWIPETEGKRCKNCVSALMKTLPGEL